MQWVNHDDDFWKLDHELGGYASIIYRRDDFKKHTLRVYNKNIDCIKVQFYTDISLAKQCGMTTLYNSVTALDYMEAACNG